MLQLDLSANFFQEFPSDALESLTNLEFLDISNNFVTVRETGMRTPFNLAAFYRSVFQAIEEVRLSGLKRLETLDLSRNTRRIIKRIRDGYQASKFQVCK